MCCRGGALVSSQTEPGRAEQLLLEFTEQFPNAAIYRGKLTAAEWLKGTTDGLPIARLRSKNCCSCGLPTSTLPSSRSSCSRIRT